MNDTFTRKKVESLTLGEKIKKLRGQYRMSLADVSKATKIQVKYLEFLENGEYDKLPAEVYVRGFLKGYARHLGLDEEVLLKLYDKEKNIQANLGKESVLDTRPRLPLTSSFVLTSRTLMLGLVALVVVGTFAYLFQKFRSFVVEPALVVYEPLDGAVVEGSTVVLRGRSDRGAEVMINGQGVFVGVDGNFSETLVLQPGINQVTVTARNRFDREKLETVAFEARFATPDDAALSEASDKFRLTVTGRYGGAIVTLEADGEIVYSGKLGDGAEQVVTASKEVRLSTDQAANTWVSFRNEPSAPLAEKSGSLKSVLYTSTGRQGE